MELAVFLLGFHLQLVSFYSLFRPNGLCALLVTILLSSAIFNKIISLLWCSWSTCSPSPAQCSSNKIPIVALHEIDRFLWTPISSSKLFLPHILSRMLRLTGSRPQKCSVQIQFTWTYRGPWWSWARLLHLRNKQITYFQTWFWYQLLLLGVRKTSKIHKLLCFRGMVKVVLLLH